MINIVLFISVIFLAYNFTPEVEMDLTRYYKMLDNLRFSPFSWEQISREAPYPETIITNFYFNIMSKVDNRSWFQVFPIAIVFSLIIFITTQFRKKYNLNFRSYSFFMICVISSVSLLGMISGIRQIVAWSFLMLAVYYDFFEKEKNKMSYTILYIIPALIHLSTIPLIIIRLFLILIQKFPWAKFLIVLWPITLIIFISFGDFFPGALQSALLTLEGHVEYNELYNVPKIIASLIGYVGFFYLSINTNKKNIPNKYYNYYILVLLFGISSIFVLTLFRRVFDFLILISLPMISATISSKFNFRRIILLGIMIMFIFLFYLQDVKELVDFIMKLATSKNP